MADEYVKIERPELILSVAISGLGWSVSQVDRAVAVTTVEVK